MREEMLLKKLKEGEESALEQLVSLYYPDILRYCIWHAPDRYLAEDAAQETFLKAINYVGTCGFSGKFKAFLYKIALNTCRDMKKSKWSKRLPLDAIADEIPYDDGGFKEIEEMFAIRAYTRGLDDLSQEIVLLRFRQNLKLREIAEVLGVPMRTVQSRMRTALRRIEAELKGGR
ncbi:MAG: sigma-70 family RNA polymerase sigma factor [Lachnospiraceae bacterium]|nr:sigma-70 family RNA polymerase sigma factor [Lachnospiraceae bacterium]MDE6186006.1 sigma-70 family RNA polymerase sigma factor [Lachnospiraceae bacterium]